MAALPSTTTRTGFGDARGVESLRQRAAADPKSAVREAAKQFESLFMQEMLKSMRQAQSMGNELDNEGSKLGTEMLDSQLASKMAGQPGGLSDLIARQLERQMGMAPGPIPKADSANQAASQSASAITSPQATTGVPQKSAASFVQQHQQAAQAASATSGIPAEFMLAQAAHETGWGRKEMRAADGTPTYNMFGIKAGANWKGPTADVTTTEYLNGQAHKVVQRFRAYGSYAESFADYASLMKNSPRYAAVVAAGSDAKGFAQGLQRAGYATDPAYAQKLTRVIDTTLRAQRSLSSA
jgi:peptidoglycan hydrolase FlgJ